MFLAIVLFFVGLVALYFGAEWLVKGASLMAFSIGITPLIVGLTIVGFGTSTPELLVSLLGSQDIAVGNIVGSNITNILLILGAAALIQPIKIQAQVLKREVPLMVLTAGIFVAVAIDGQLSLVDGIILLAGMAGYLGYIFMEARRNMAAFEAELKGEVGDIDTEKSGNLKNILLVIGGLLGLVVGAKLMVDSAVYIAKSLGVSELVIALSIVALGTSLPELATSVVAAFRGESDIALGNVVGSNIFNFLFVMGAVVVVGIFTMGEAIAVNNQVVSYDLWWMSAVTVGIWFFMRTGFVLSRTEGAVLLLIYVGYVISLFLR